MTHVEVLLGNITELSVDAIVNAGNPTLLGGGGVDGAIHSAAGPGLLEACRAIEEVTPGVRCPTGQARITGGFLLPARYVIHTVGPVWRGTGDEPRLLAACYAACIDLARAHGVRSVAFPAVSTGVYGFPKPLAARIAVETIGRELTAPVAGALDASAGGSPIERVVLVAFRADDAQHWQAALDAHGPLASG